MADALQIVGEIAKLDVRPGDTVVVRLKGRLPGEQIENVRKHVAACLPDGVKGLVLDDSVASLEVLGAQPAIDRTVDRR